LIDPTGIDKLKKKRITKFEQRWKKSGKKNGLFSGLPRFEKKLG